jgi:c-di-GMP-related signal transduction protein
MPVQVIPVNGTDSALAGLTGGLRYFARQPILNLQGRVYAYELLFRSGEEGAFRGDGDLATRIMLDNTVLFGMEKLTGGLPAFVNCTKEALEEGLVEVLPPEMTVLEVLEDLEPTPELIAACRKLKAAGFRLALDDFVWQEGIEPLVELADYIKVDFIQTPAAERKALMRRLGGRPITMLAEKVETYEEYQRACAEGFTLIQGYYFCKPVLLTGQKIPANRLFHFEILKNLRREPLDVPSLSGLVKRDASLAYRLLRLINSPMCAIQQEVRSIESALLAVGDDWFRRMATLAIASELNGCGPLELLRMAFVRGRFCELAAGLCGLDPGEQYLVGLLSLLPAMTHAPMEAMTPALPLRAEVRKALEGADVAERSLLKWTERHELGDWAGCDAVARARGFDVEAAVSCYAEAVLWAEEAMPEAG